MCRIDLAPARVAREGAPLFTCPSVWGVSPEKPILFRIPLLGERAMRVTARHLPEGVRQKVLDVAGDAGDAGKLCTGMVCGQDHRAERRVVDREVYAVNQDDEQGHQEDVPVYFISKSVFLCRIHSLYFT